MSFTTTMENSTKESSTLPHTTEGKVTNCTGQDVNCELSWVMDCFWRYLLENYSTYLPVLGGVLALLIIFNTMCIYWCVRRQLYRQLQSIQKKDFNANEGRPISEAITCIYKPNDEEKEFAYDLVSNAKDVSNLRTSNERCSSVENEKQFVRLMSHNSDYDNVWSTTWTTLTSPEAEYTQVEKVKKISMTFNQDEEIYSKQKLDFIDTTVSNAELLNDSIQKKAETEGTLGGNDDKSIAVHEPKMVLQEKKIDMIAKTDQKSDTNKANKNNDKTNDNKCKENNFQQHQMKISAEVCQKDKTYPLETNKNNLSEPVKDADLESGDINNDKTDSYDSERDDSPSSQMTAIISPEEVHRKNERAYSKTENKSEDENRCRRLKGTGELREESNGSKSQRKCGKIEKLAIDGKRKTKKSRQGDDYCNISIKPERIKDVGNISKEEADRLVDEATAILMANMNNVSLKTKL